MRGFSLIEGVLSMFLLFVAISMVFGVFPGAHRASDLAVKHSLARELAAETMAVQGRLEFADLRSVARHAAPAQMVRNGVTVPVDLFLTVQVTPNGLTKEVLVEVDWEGHRVQLETIRADL